MPLLERSEKVISHERDFIHTGYDALGSTRDLTDTAEVETDEYSFYAFGNQRSNRKQLPVGRGTWLLPRRRKRQSNGPSKHLRAV